MSDGDRKVYGAAANPAYQFPKGKSGNPAGRPKGYEKRIRECVESMTADDPVPDPEGGKDEDGKPLKIPAFEAIVKRAVLDAIRGDKYARDFIADRLMGKPKQQVSITPDSVEVPPELPALSTTALEVLALIDGGDDSLH